jgi:hypothetical protein
MSIGCHASPKSDANNLFVSQKYNGYGKVVNDSIASIMLNAKHITCRLQSKSKEDSVRRDSICTISSKLNTVVQYLFFDANNFKSDDKVFGKFISWACFTFQGKMKQTVYLELDFGLAKWRLLDCKKKQICSKDMKEDNRQFLHFTQLIFPNDKTLMLLYNNLNSKK